MTNLQTVTQTYTAAASTTTTIPASSAPTTANGALLFTQVLTPTDAGSKIVIDVCPNADCSGLVGMAFALFEGSTLIGVRAMVQAGSLNRQNKLRWVVDAGSTSARTYTVRYGPHVAGTLYINLDQLGPTHDYGDSLRSTLTISEYTGLLHQQSTTKTTSTTTIGIASTPTTSDGVLLFTQAVTPASASSKLIVEATIQFDGAAGVYAACLFEDSTLIGTCPVTIQTASHNEVFCPRWYVPAVSTSSRTYTVRVGGAGGSFKINDDSSASSTFGDSFQSDLVIKEY